MFDEDSMHFPENKPTMDETTKLDQAIQEEYSDVLENPKGIPPRRPYLGIGDFRIQLALGSKPPYRPPYWMTPAEKTEYTKNLHLKKIV
jgi:hypothetical protein